MDINLDGLMIETHNNPTHALSDADQQIQPNHLKEILKNLVVRGTKLRDEVFRNELLNYRNQIDLLDNKIVSMLNDRKKIVEEIAILKPKINLLFSN